MKIIGRATGKSGGLNATSLDEPLANSRPQGSATMKSTEEVWLRGTPRMSGPMSDFTSLVECAKAKCKGTDGTGREQPFVPYKDLYEFWTPTHIYQVLSTCQPHLSYPFTTIKNDYLRIFSLLVYANLVSALQFFVVRELTDHDLAKDIENSTLSHALKPDLYKKIRKAVQQYQWLFSPVAIGLENLPNQQLSDLRILPFTLGDEIRQGSIGSASVRKVDVCDSYRSNSKTTYILKSYDEHGYNHYKHEREAFHALHLLNNKNIIGFHGSFQQGNRYHLLLQYVDGGNLEDYFTNTPRPTSESDVHRFWASIWPVWRGLHGLHQGVLGGCHFVGVHQDLKLDNILISRGSSGSVYDFTPIITDFGHSCFTPKVNGDEEQLVQDRHGNAQFSAPEGSHHSLYLKYGPSRITSSADIWSMGCIMSVTAAWVHRGMEGVREYESQRQDETRTVPNFDDINPHAYFHNGAGTLAAVSAKHACILGGCAEGSITRRVVDIITTDCLCSDARQRRQAHFIHERLWGNNGQVTPPTTPPPKGSKSSALAPHKSTNMFLGIDQCIDWISARKEGREPDGEINTAISRLWDQLNDREYIFVIDDTPSMRSYRAQVKESFYALAEIAKPMDPNRIELIFASRPYVSHKLNNGFYWTFRGISKRILATFDDCKFDQIAGLMEQNLEKILDGRLKPGCRPTSLFILTDGKWGCDERAACGVQNQIIRVMNFTKQRNSRNLFMVQFVRFGDDPDGIRHLKFLDKLGFAYEWDNVDHKAITSDVGAILLGSIAHRIDVMGEETSDSSPSTPSIWSPI